MPITLPLTGAAWSILLAASFALAGVGTEYLRRPVYEGPHWSNDIAAAVMWSGRAGVWLALFLFVAGQVAV
jgi:uncharacterized membrane protein YccF (DUF307 family)